MKKILSMLLALTMATSLVACGGEKKESQNNNSVTENEQTETTDEEEKTDEEPVEESEDTEEKSVENTDEMEDDDSVEEYIDYTGMIPNPEETFTTGTIYLLQGGGDKYMFQVEGYSDDEYDMYVSKCKEMGFSKVDYQNSSVSGKTFGAYSEDEKYFVDAFTSTSSGNAYVTFEKAEDAK